MSHTSLLFPHPIIRPGGFDYTDCHFKMQITQARRAADIIHLELSFDLCSNTITNMIKEQQAKFYVTVKCTKTYQRITFDSGNHTMQLDLPLSDYSDKLNIMPYVATTRPISKFSSAEHDDELKKLIPNGVDLPEGAILAVEDPHEVVIDSIEKIQAAISIVRNDKLKEGEYVITTIGDLINIEMHPNTHDGTRRLRDKAPALLYPSIYVTALEHAIRDLEENSGRPWA